MNFQAAWSTRQGRIRIILIAIILATIPFYCLGFIIIITSENRLGEPTPTSNLDITPTLIKSATNTPPTLVYFSSPTITRTPTISLTPTVTRTYAIPPTLTLTEVPTLTETLTPEPSVTNTETLNPTNTETMIPTDEPTPTP